MVTGFFTPGADTDPASQTPEAVARRRRLAEALMAQGSDTSEIKSWTQGAARLAKALVGGMHASQADRMEREGRTSANQALMRALMGDTAPTPPMQLGSAEPQASRTAAPAPRPANSGPMPAFAMPGLAEGISSATSKYNLDPSYLPRLAQVESSGGRNLQNPNSTAGGAFGFLDSTGKEYGLTNKNDPNASADAAARLATDNARVLRQRLGRDPTPGELYLAHQQGAGGASALLGNPDRPALDVLTQVYGGNAAKARAALVNNGGDPSMTAGQFAQKWIGKFGGERSMPQMAQAPGTTPDGMPLNPVPSDAQPMAYAPQNQSGLARALAPGASSPSSTAPAYSPSANDPASVGFLPGNQGRTIRRTPENNPEGTAPGGVGAGGGSPTSPAIPQPLANSAALVSAISSPWLSEGQRNIATMALKERMSSGEVKPVDLGNQIALINGRGQVMGYMPKTRDGADWQLVKDNDGNPVGRFNARTGTTEPLASAIAPAGTKAPPVQRVKQPDGSEMAVQWDSRAGKWVPLDAPQGGNPVQPTLGKLTEQQSKDVGFWQRGIEANKGITLEAEKALTNASDVGLENVPGILGLRPARALQRPEFQTAHNSARNFLAVILRKDTGAAITGQEWTEYTPLFIPQPGDTPALIEQKRRNRTVALDAIKDGLGKTGDDLKRIVDARNAERGAGAGNAAGAGGQPVRVTSPDEARKLPSGTRIILPDGSPGVVP